MQTFNNLSANSGTFYKDSFSNHFFDVFELNTYYLQYPEDYTMDVSLLKNSFVPKFSIVMPNSLGNEMLIIQTILKYNRDYFGSSVKLLHLLTLKKFCFFIVRATAASVLVNLVAAIHVAPCHFNNANDFKIRFDTLLS